MKSGVALAFDYGTKFIGIAVGSILTGSAQGVDTVNNGKQGPDWGKISHIVKEWKPSMLVVGLPLNMDGSETGLTAQATEFGDHLRDRYNLPVHMVDERLTTSAARQTMHDAGISLKRTSKPKLDQKAAETILLSFLNEQKRVRI